MTSFDELMSKFNLIKEQIMKMMGYGDQDQASDVLEFSKHLYETKCWYIRVSWKNKKRILLDLIDEVKDLWVVSLLLKSIWNCRPKDAVLSICENQTLSSYDQVPLDHNRTILSSSLKDVIIKDRIWFSSLESEQQCLVLAELLSVAGGPIMWEVLKYVQNIYENHLDQQTASLKECIIVNDPPPEKKTANIEVVKKEQTPRRKSSATQVLESSTQPFISRQAQQELETNLALWTSTIKGVKDNLKLEEVEMIYNDDTKKRIWRINRLKPDAAETVDFIQLLPSAIGKRILFHLPLNQLGDCARVNKYWAYLVDEFRAELNARQKIDIELGKLRENMLRHDASLGLLNQPEAKTKPTECIFNKRSRAQELRLELNKNKKRGIKNLPYRNMADFNTRLDIRGAADENIRKWCANISKIYNVCGELKTQAGEVLIKRENIPYLAPLLSTGINIPLNPPLTVDPTKNISHKNKIEEGNACSQK